jgi:hypothetical protein
MAAGDEGHQDLVEDRLLADDALGDLGAQLRRGREQGVAVAEFREARRRVQRTGRRRR